MTDYRFRKRRRLLSLALLAPLASLGCGGSQAGGQIEIGEATKAEVKARAELYRARAQLKQQQQQKKKKSAPRRS